MVSTLRQVGIASALTLPVPGAVLAFVSRTPPQVELWDHPLLSLTFLLSLVLFWLALASAVAKK